MEVVYILLYAILALAGFFLQNALHSGLRFVIYPLSFVLGILAGYYFSYPFGYCALSFNIGMIGRAVVGGYWLCVAVECMCLFVGVFVGIYLI